METVNKTYNDLFKAPQFLSRPDLFQKEYFQVSIFEWDAQTKC